MTIVDELGKQADRLSAEGFSASALLATRAAGTIARLSAACRGLVGLVDDFRHGCPQCRERGEGTVTDPKKHASDCPIGLALAAILAAEGGTAR